MYQSLTHLLPQYEALVFEEESIDESRTQTGAVCQGMYGFPRWHSGKEFISLHEIQEKRARYLVGKIPWHSNWQPTPVFLPGEFPWTEEPVGYSPWGHTESYMTEQLST